MLIHRLGWGVGNSVREKGVAIQEVHILKYKDQQSLGRAPVTRKFGEQFVVHRADLHNALVQKMQELPNVELKLNSAVKGVDFDQASVALNSGETVEGDVVLGADGIKSVIRPQLLGEDHGPIPTGDAVYRVMIPAEQMREDPELRPFIEEAKGYRWVGPHRHIMAYPVRGHQLFNMVLAHPERRELEESWTVKGSKKELLAEYEGWDSRLVKMLQKAPEGDVLEWKLCSHAPLDTWIRGKVTLMGDACHPMLPYVAQGAAQACEDAAALSTVLSLVEDKNDIPLALKAFERSQKQRAERVQGTAAQTRHNLHLVDGPEQIERDRLFAAVEKGEKNPDQWGDPETQKFLWEWDAEAKASESWAAVSSKSGVKARL